LIFVFDLKYFAIPEEILYSGVFFVFIVRAFQIFNFGNFDPSLFKNLIFAFLPSFCFFLIAFFSKEKLMGWGDFWISLLISLYLGFPKVIFALILAIFLGAIFGLFLIFLKKGTLKSKLPFAPFLFFGTVFALCFEKFFLRFFSLFFTM
ncbi:prepilin peptidase, partial [Candidatus Parcubacteria bacterium]|nr:prepilin peptidase [Candidatus Parcubacteria bacterium]